MRTFVALPLPLDKASVVSDWVQQLKVCDRENAVRWVKSDRFHLTLCFLGKTPLEAVERLIDRLQQVARRLSSLEIRLHGLGFFPERGRARVVWCDVEDESAALLSLADAVRDACSPFIEKPESKPFRAHLTLGRVRERLQKGTLETMTQRAKAFDSGSVAIPAFQLYQSTLKPSGSVYRVLARCPLGTKTTR